MNRRQQFKHLNAVAALRSIAREEAPAERRKSYSLIRWHLFQTRHGRINHGRGE
jgi:hypothetical protein